MIEPKGIQTNFSKHSCSTYLKTIEYKLPHLTGSEDALLLNKLTKKFISESEKKLESKMPIKALFERRELGITRIYDIS